MTRKTAQHRKSSLENSSKYHLFLVKWRRKLQRYTTNREQITKGEFFKFFIIPMCVSLALTLFLLFQISVINISLPSTRSILPQSAIFSGLLRFPGSLFAQNSSMVHDPYVLLLDLKKGDLPYTLVDLRSDDEYEKGHIRQAMSLPMYASFHQMRDGKIDEKELKEKIKTFDKKKPFVLYAHSRDSQITQDVAFILRKNGRDVRILGVGWNEWKHFRNAWLPEPEWGNIDMTNFVEERE